MLNLSLQDVLSADINYDSSAVEDDPITHFCLDSTDGLLYAVTRQGLVLCMAEAGKKVPTTAHASALWSDGSLNG